jgi:ubiquinone/menaquinone biosynthesis C-methylase UbiE
MVININPEYLHLTAASPGVQAVKRRAYELLDLAAGSRVVDVGCGPAIDTISLARIVGPSGYVTGIDSDAGMVVTANRLATEAGTGTFSRHIVADATAIRLPAASADACYSERLLQHMPWRNAERAVGEFVRVVRPGGTVVVADTDWATLSIGALDPFLERKVVRQHASWFPNPFSGRYLPAMLVRAGLVQLTTESFSLPISFNSMEFLLRPTIWAGVVSGSIQWFEAERWWREMRNLRDHREFFAHVSLVLAGGRIARRSTTDEPVLARANGNLHGK